MTLQELKRQQPELIQQIRAEAMEEAVLAERQKILNIASIVAPELTAKLKPLIDAGVTPEQVKVLLNAVPAVSERDKKAEILDALKQAHGEGVAGNVPEPARGQNPLIAAVQRRNKEGSEGVGKENPLLRAVREKNLA
jgi:hypothetical protein